MIPRDAVSDLVPFTHVKDVDRSVEFYARLGFELADPDGYVLTVAEIEGERVGVLPD